MLLIITILKCSLLPKENMHDSIDVTSILLVGNFVLYPISVEKVLLINMVSFECSHKMVSNQGWEKLIARVKVPKTSSTIVWIYLSVKLFCFLFLLIFCFAFSGPGELGNDREGGWVRVLITATDPPGYLAVQQYIRYHFNHFWLGFFINKIK